MSEPRKEVKCYRAYVHNSPSKYAHLHIEIANNAYEDENERYWPGEISINKWSLLYKWQADQSWIAGVETVEKVLAWSGWYGYDLSVSLDDSGMYSEAEGAKKIFSLASKFSTLLSAKFGGWTPLNVVEMLDSLHYGQVYHDSRVSQYYRVDKAIPDGLKAYDMRNESRDLEVRVIAESETKARIKIMQTLEERHKHGWFNEKKDNELLVWWLGEKCPVSENAPMSSYCTTKVRELISSYEPAPKPEPEEVLVEQNV